MAVFVFAAVLGLAAQVAQPAVEPALAPAAASQTRQAPAGDAMICHQIVYTGTRFASKECHTQREWKQMAQDADDYKNYVEQRVQGYCFSAGPCH